MKVIYENQVKASGVAVEEFKDAGMFIIFGDNAPEEIKDYCYSVSVNPINGTIAAGQYVVVDDAAIEIPPSDQVYKSCFRCSVLVFKGHLNAHLSIRAFCEILRGNLRRKGIALSVGGRNGL